MRVSSSNISDLDYDEETRILTATFVSNGARAEYFEVPMHVWGQLKAVSQGGGSVGQAFNALIKNGGYAFQYV